MVFRISVVERREVWLGIDGVGCGVFFVFIDWKVGIRFCILVRGE